MAEIGLERIKTYVKGLDPALEGGIPEGSVVLVSGQPGTMKSSMTFWMLHQNALRGKVSSIYVSLEQSSKSLREHMAGLGMEYDPVQMLLGIQDLGMIRKKIKVVAKKAWTEAYQKMFESLVKDWKPKIVVIDQLQVFMMLARHDEPREGMFHFLEWLRDLDITTFIVSEMQPGSRVFAPADVDFLADGIIHLDLKREGNVVNLFLGVAKMRKTMHKRAYYPLICERAGMEIVTD